MRVAMQCAISQLLMYFAILCRIQVYKVIIANLFFIVAWTLNFAIVTNLYSNAVEPRINDDFAINLVYLFGGFAGLVTILDTPSRIVIKTRLQRHHPQYPKIFAVLGIFFMSIAFAFTHATLGKKDVIVQSNVPINNNYLFNSTTDQRIVFMPEGSIAVFLAVSSSVVSCAAWSVIISKNSKMHIADFMGSSIGGAIMVGSTAGFANNLAIPVVLGMAAGFFCTLYKAWLQPKINRRNMKDALGLIGPFVICPIIGCFIATPIIIFCYSNYSIIPPQLNGAPIDIVSSRYILIYQVLSMALGVVGGMATSSVFRWFKGN